MNRVSSTNWLVKAWVFLKKKQGHSFLVFLHKLEEPKFTAGSFSPLSSELMGALTEVTALAYE